MIFSILGPDSAQAKSTLSKALLRQPNEFLVWACGLVGHCLAAAAQVSSEATVQGCLSAIALISRRARDTPEERQVKQILFAEMEVMKALIYESTWTTREF